MDHTRRRTAKLPQEPLPRATLPNEIYRRIRELILDGGIAPGELVTIQGLARAFGVSAMPVREALQRLTAERALTVISGRSVGIPDLSADKLRDLCRVRLELETMAAAWAVGRLPPRDLHQLESLVAAMGKAVADGNARHYVRANHEFHFVIYRASGSDTLLSIIEGLWLQVSPYFHLLHGSGNYVMANRQHERALEALKRNDSAAAAAAIRADIEGAAQVLLTLLG
jgi:DNA-binding GntR family transcriptional regulator